MNEDIFDSEIIDYDEYLNNKNETSKEENETINIPDLISSLINIIKVVEKNTGVNIPKEIVKTIRSEVNEEF